MKDHIFRSYDIRGTFDVDFREEDVEKLGYAMALFLRKETAKNYCRTRHT